MVDKHRKTCDLVYKHSKRRKTVECVTIEDLAQAIEAEAVKSAEGNECELVSVWWRFGTYRELLLGYQACKRILFCCGSCELKSKLQINFLCSKGTSKLGSGRQSLSSCMQHV